MLYLHGFLELLLRFATSASVFDVLLPLHQQGLSGYFLVPTVLHHLQDALVELL